MPCSITVVSNYFIYSECDCSVPTWNVYPQWLYSKWCRYHFWHHFETRGARCRPTNWYVLSTVSWRKGMEWARQNSVVSSNSAIAFVVSDTSNYMWAGQGKLYVGCSVICINYACIGCMYTINVSLEVYNKYPLSLHWLACTHIPYREGNSYINVGTF